MTVYCSVICIGTLYNDLKAVLTFTGKRIQNVYDYVCGKNEWVEATPEKVQSSRIIKIINGKNIFLFMSRFLQMHKYFILHNNLQSIHYSFLLQCILCYQFILTSFPSLIVLIQSSYLAIIEVTRKFLVR